MGQVGMGMRMGMGREMGVSFRHIPHYAVTVRIHTIACPTVFPSKIEQVFINSDFYFNIFYISKYFIRNSYCFFECTCILQLLLNEDQKQLRMINGPFFSVLFPPLFRPWPRPFHLTYYVSMCTHIYFFIIIISLDCNPRVSQDISRPTDPFGRNTSVAVFCPVAEYAPKWRGVSNSDEGFECVFWNRSGIFVLFGESTLWKKDTFL